MTSSVTGFVLSDEKTTASRPPGSAASTQRWLRVGEVAHALGVSANTVRRWTDAGKVRSYRSLGGHRRYLEDEIGTLLAAQPQWQPRPAAADGSLRAADGATVGAVHIGAAAEAGAPADGDDSTGEVAGKAAAASAKAGVDVRSSNLSLAHLHELVELGTLAARTRDIEQLMQIAAERLLRSTDSTTCDIWRLESGVFRCLVSVNRDGPDDTQVGKLVEWTPPSATAAAIAANDAFLPSRLMIRAARSMRLISSPNEALPVDSGCH